MANESIRAAFERLWYHIVLKVGAKADKSEVTSLQLSLNEKSDASHTHDDRYYTETEVDSKIAQKTQVQIVTWEDDD